MVSPLWIHADYSHHLLVLHVWKWFTWFSSTGGVFVAPCFPTGLRALGFLKVSFTSKDWTEADTEYLGHFLVLCHQVLCLLQQKAHISLLFLTADLPVGAFLVVLHIPDQIQLQAGFAFPNPIPAHSDSISIFLPCHLTLLPCLVCILFITEFCQELLVRLYRSLAAFAWLPACWDP